MKKALKRLSSLVVCGTLSLTLFAGCSGSSSDTSSTAAGSAVSGSTSASASGGETVEKQFEGVKLVYWSNWEATEPQGVVITEAVKAFEEETGATVDLQFKGRKGIKEGLIPALDAEQKQLW